MTKIILKTEPCFSLDESETLLNGSFPAYRFNEFGEEMTNEEKCKLLRKNYSKWNAQTNSNNVKTKNLFKKFWTLQLN